MVVIVIVIGVAIVLIAVAAVVVTRRRRGRLDAPPPEARVARPEPAPMTGLEEALNRATDRSGTTMADRLDAESAKVDGMRVVDDTGPLLRRALDRLDTIDDTPPDGTGAAPADAPTTDGGRAES